MILIFISTVYLVCTTARAGIIKNDTDVTRFCQLPVYPAHGRYEVEGDGSAYPSKLFHGRVYVTVDCDEGFAVNGSSRQMLTCDPDMVHLDLPQCVRYCALGYYAAKEYMCRSPPNNLSRPCYSLELIGTNATPVCTGPQNHGSPKSMKCTEQGWDRDAKCSRRPARGTNITILATDKIEVFISSIDYKESHIDNTQRKNASETNAGKTVDSDSDNDDDIDKTFWRFGESHTKPSANSNSAHNMKMSISNGRNNAENVNITIENGKVQIGTGQTVINVNK